MQCESASSRLVVSWKNHVLEFSIELTFKPLHLKNKSLYLRNVLSTLIETVIVVEKNNLHSYLSDCSILSENVVHLLGRDLVRQVPDVKNTVHLWR